CGLREGTRVAVGRVGGALATTRRGAEARRAAPLSPPPPRRDARSDTVVTRRCIGCGKRRKESPSWLIAMTPTAAPPTPAPPPPTPATTPPPATPPCTTACPR